MLALGPPNNKYDVPINTGMKVIGTALNRPKEEQIRDEKYIPPTPTPEPGPKIKASICKIRHRFKNRQFLYRFDD